MRLKFIAILIILMPVFLYGQNTAPCSEFPKWQKLMDKGKFEEAYKLAVKVGTYPEDGSSVDKNKFNDFQKKYGEACLLYFTAEAAYRQGNLALAVSEATKNFRGLTYDYNAPAVLDKLVHYTLEFGEKELLANNIESAFQALSWAADASKYKQGKCPGFPDENSGKDHLYQLVELLGDAWAKKENYPNALKYYQLYDSAKYSPEINNKIALVKISAVKQKKNAAEIAEEEAKKAKKQIEDNAKQKIKKDEENKRRQQQEEIDKNARTIRMYADGNVSIKINNSKDFLSKDETETWLKNSSLAFSENGEELYCQDSTDKYYQVWSIAKKEKIAEIPFSEASSTKKGREVSSAFINNIYNVDTNANTQIWLSSNISLSFDKRNKFTILDEQNQTTKSFELEFFNSLMIYGNGDKKNYKANQLLNFNYKVYLHKKSNRLFIVCYADHYYPKYKSTAPYWGVFCFDRNNNMLTNPIEFVQGISWKNHPYKDKFYFSNNSLLHYYIDAHEATQEFKQFDLATISPGKINYENPYLMLNAKVRWYWDHIGTDQNDNTYILDPRGNKMRIVEFEMGDSAKQFERANIIHSANKRNEVPNPEKNLIENIIWFKNVIAVSPSGKYFAYIGLNNRSEEGNYASIFLYNLDQKDRVYTLNDQTKYQPFIAKNYVTDKESEDFLNAKKQADELAKKQRKALYQANVDSLKTKIAAAEKLLAANYKLDTDLLGQKKYGEVLAGKKWIGDKTVEVTTNYIWTNGVRSPMDVSSDFEISEKLEFAVREQGIGIFGNYEEKITMPGGKEIDGIYILKDKEITSAGSGYSWSEYVKSKCNGYIIDVSTGERNLTSPEFKFYGNSVSACSEIKGLSQNPKSESYKSFTDDYMLFILHSTFEIAIANANSPVVLVATGKSGSSILFNYIPSQLQEKLKDNVYFLQSELKQLEQFIETGK